MVWFDPDLPVLRFHLNNTSPTARLTARCYCARRKDKSEFLSNFVSTKIKTIKPIILDQLCLPTPMAHQCFAPKCWPAGLMPTDRNPRHRTRLKNRIGLSKLETFLWWMLQENFLISWMFQHSKNVDSFSGASANQTLLAHVCIKVSCLPRGFDYAAFTFGPINHFKKINLKNL